LLDLGEREFLKYKPECIFVTHLHPDHAFFVKGPAGIDAHVYAPEPSKNANIKIITDPIKIGSYTITPIPSHHSKWVKSNAYLFDNGEQKLLYTGDIVWINKEYHHLFNNLRLVITDGSYIRKGGFIKKDKETGQIYGHTSIPDLINLFQHYTKHILFIHFGNWFFNGVKTARQKLKMLGITNQIKIGVGYDGMRINLDKL
jgi:ribonuclease BN (tRNA processing enzyme)